MSDFKVGDRVKCIHADGYDGILVEGDIYTVESIQSDGSWVHLQGVDHTGNFSWRFEKVEDTITVTLPISDAQSYAKRYSDSKYLAPALAEATKSQFPEVPFCLGEIDPSVLPDKSVFVYNDTVRVRASLRDAASEIGCSVIGEAYRGSFHRTSMVALHSQVVFIPEKAKISVPDKISFEMPLDVARKFNDCTIAPLVKAWDRENAPKSELLVWLKEMANGTAFRFYLAGGRKDHKAINGRDLFIKEDQRLVQYGNLPGTKQDEMTLEKFINLPIYRDLKPSDFTIL